MIENSWLDDIDIDRPRYSELDEYKCNTRGKRDTSYEQDDNEDCDF